MKTGVRVCDAMTTKPVAICHKLNLVKCAKLMKTSHVGTLLVKDNGTLLGIVTEQDIVRNAVALGKSPADVTVKAIMERKLITVSPEKDIFDALVLMKKKNIRHLPVMQGKKMVGLLTLKDILKIEPELFEMLVDKFELREERRKPITVIQEEEGVCEGCGRLFDHLHKVDTSLLCDKCRDEQL